MKSVILISSSDKEVANLFQQWKNKATNMYVDNYNLSMLIDGKGIYIDYCENGANYYEEGELDHVDIDTPLFYSICYSNSKIMKYFIQNSIFGEGSFMDNDFGTIMRVDELRKQEILDFIE